MEHDWRVAPRHNFHLSRTAGLGREVDQGWSHSDPGEGVPLAPPDLAPRCTRFWRAPQDSKIHRGARRTHRVGPSTVVCQTIPPDDVRDGPHPKNVTGAQPVGVVCDAPPGFRHPGTPVLPCLLRCVDRHPNRPVTAGPQELHHPELNTYPELFV